MDVSVILLLSHVKENKMMYQTLFQFCKKTENTYWYWMRLVAFQTSTAIWS